MKLTYLLPRLLDKDPDRQMRLVVVQWSTQVRRDHEFRV